MIKKYMQIEKDEVSCLNPQRLSMACLGLKFFHKLSLCAHLSSFLGVKNQCAISKWVICAIASQPVLFFPDFFWVNTVFLQYSILSLSTFQPSPCFMLLVLVLGLCCPIGQFLATLAFEMELKRTDYADGLSIHSFSKNQYKKRT